MHPDAQHSNRTIPSRANSTALECETGDGSIHGQIEALIPRLRRYARALTRDTVAADDLVQECLTRALGKIHLWEPGTDLRAWLFTILHHRHVSDARSEARRRACIKLQKSDPDGALSPSQTVRLELRDLERAITQLPEEQRSVILLVALQGMGYEEAAAIVKLPVGTVRSRVSRGREALRAITGLFPLRYSQRGGNTANPNPPPRPRPGGNHFAAPLRDLISTSQPQEIFQ